MHGIRSTLRRGAVAAVASAGLAATALTSAPVASAGSDDDARRSAAVPDSRSVSAVNAQTREAAGVIKLARSVDGSAGTYYDAKTKSFVVNVTDRTDLRSLRTQGVSTRLVDFSNRQLSRVSRALGDKAAIPGTSWATNPKTNRVEVQADRSVSKAQLRKIRTVSRPFGERVSVRRVAGELSTTISGGEAILSGGGRCSLGFNVTDGSSYYFLTAGHCGSAGSSWTDGGGGGLGTMQDSQFPGNDFAIVSVGGPQGSGDVYLYPGSQDITASGSAFVGQGVQRSGSTTGVFGGSVQALNATVNYAEGSVSGLIRTSVCAEPGDSGGSLFAGGTALGLTSGGNGNCSSGGTTYFQPVDEVLATYGVSVY